MAEGKSEGQRGNLAKFIQELSEAADLLERYAQDPEAAMAASGLTEAEKAVVRSGDEDAILDALGIETTKAPRFRFRIRNIRIRFGV
jgi:hypothetical protein